MMKTMKLLLASTMTLLIANQAAFASTMPKADQAGNSVAIGSGPSLAVDFKLSPRTSLGASAGLPLVRNFQFSRYDIRLNHQFIKDRFTLSGIIGLWGDGRFNPTENDASPLGVELGVGMAYDFTPQLVGRLNLVSGVPIFNAGNYDVFSFFLPSSGLELAYKFTPNIEGTIGANGNGDLLGVRFNF